MKTLPIAAAVWMAIACSLARAEAPSAPRAQIFNNHMPNPADLPGVGFVWGAKQPLRAQGVIDSFYYPNQRDLDRKHDLAWFKANQPDWITYTCDRQKPSYGYEYGWGAYAPLDTSNPEVRKYILNRYIAPALASGYKAIALDNVSILNTDKRCGVYRKGAWVQLYSGESRDPAHTKDKLDWIGWLAGEIRKRGGKVVLNAKVVPDLPAETSELINLGDIWLDEGGFSDHCKHRVVDDLWTFKRSLIRKLGDRGYVSVNYTCDASSASLAPEEKSWIVASYLVNRNAHSYLAVLGRGESGKTPALRIETAVGAPTGEATNNGSVYSRPYERGLAVVNISGASPAHFRLPAGAWRTEQGATAESDVTLPPRSGRVFLRAAH